MKVSLAQHAQKYAFNVLDQPKMIALNVILAFTSTTNSNSAFNVMTRAETALDLLILTVWCAQKVTGTLQDLIGSSTLMFRSVGLASTCVLNAQMMKFVLFAMTATECTEKKLIVKRVNMDARNAMPEETSALNASLAIIQ